MKLRLIAVVVLLMVAYASYAATFPGSISREPLVRGDVSDRLSVGLGYDRIERGITFKDGLGRDTLQADSISGYVGYNALPWLTTFITAGATTLRGDQWRSHDYALRVSAGMNAYIWEGDVLKPAFAAGRISIKGTAEVLRHEADTDAGTTDWFEFIAALPIGYEIFDRYVTSSSGLSTSLALYAGPAISVVDGDMAVSPGVTQAFEQDQLLGAVAGADVFFAPSFSVGFKALIFDKVTTGASLRFHF